MITIIMLTLISIAIVQIFWCMIKIITTALDRYIRNKRRKEHLKEQQLIREHAGEKIIDIRTKQLYKKDGTQ